MALDIDVAHIEWLQEREANCRRIAATKPNGSADQMGWLSDAQFFHRIITGIQVLQEQRSHLRGALHGLLDAFSLGPLDAAAKYGPDFDLRAHEENAVSVARAALATTEALRSSLNSGRQA